MDNVKKINEELRKYQEEWYKNIVEEWVKDRQNCKEVKYYMRKHFHDETYGISQPFFTGMYDNENNNPVVMFVGQETNCWGNFKDFTKDEIEKSQRCVCEFTKNNIVEPNKKATSKDYEGFKLYDSNIFWNFIRYVYDEMDKKINVKTNVVWNELDKIHFTHTEKERTQCVKLWKDDEEKLNKEVKDSKSLLLLEIETIEPDLIVFLTGPNYRRSMETALGMKLTNTPSSDQPVVPIDNKILWTYHPRYLYIINRQDDVCKEIIQILKNK